MIGAFPDASTASDSVMPKNRDQNKQTRLVVGGAQYQEPITAVGG